MKTKSKFTKRLMSILLCLTLIISYIPISSLAANVSAAGRDTAYQNTADAEKVSDPGTVNDWKNFFGKHYLDTTHAGTVWTDKSVFNNVEDYLNATDESDSNIGLSMDDENNFLVALSAIASSKSVEGYSTSPTDTMLVLDLSASMETNQAVSALVQSANDAIKRLLELNANNRVGVVAYSGRSTTGSSAVDTAEVILPLGRYTAGLNAQGQSAFLVSSWRSGNNNRTGVKVASGVTATVADGVTNNFSTNNNKTVDGGTYIQNGLYQAWQQFEDVTDTTITDGVQAGTKRVPVIVLLSDGAPTAATTDYTNVEASNSGNGSSNYATTGMAFLTQLTASWVKDKVEEKYNNNALFYTLGLNVGNNSAAKNVLDPANNTATDSYWTTFKGKANAQNKDMTVTIRGNGDKAENKTVTYTAPVFTSGWDENYVTEYFPAANAAGLINAFSSIVEQIVIQSLYYPTLVETGNSINEDGFLEFEDYIGKNMTVKSVKGIQLGTKLYDGHTIAKMIYEGGMGTVENPTDVGNNLVWSVQKRAGIETVEETREFLGDAYAAGQLYYNPDTGEYSNYLGWYADEDGKFVSFWDGKDDSPEAVPDEYKATAVFANKSYMYYDAIGSDDSHRKTEYDVCYNQSVYNPEKQRGRC